MTLVIEFIVAALLVGVLSVLVVMSLLHSRASQSTKGRLEATAPPSATEITAGGDVLQPKSATSTPCLNRAVEQLSTTNVSESELEIKDNAINRHEIELNALRNQLRAFEEELAVKATAAREAERAVSERELELSKLSSALDERSTLADLQNVEIVALRMQVKSLQERLAHVDEQAKALEDRRDGAAREAERALSKNASELGKLTSVLEERSALADSQKVEIVTLKMQVQTLQEWLSEADQHARVVESGRDAAIRALSDKESELIQLTSALDERSALADSQKAEILALRMRAQTLQEQLTQADEQVRGLEDRRDAVVSEAQLALWDKESELVRLTSAVDERSALADLLRTEIAALGGQVQTLQEQLTQAGERARGLEGRHYAAMREAELTLSQRETELSRLTGAVDDHLALADLLKAEIVTLTRQVNTLRDRLTEAGLQAMAVEERRNVERGEFQVANQRLLKAHVDFENCYGRVAELVLQLLEPTADDEILGRYVREYLENCLVGQRPPFNQRELELQHLRCEIALKAEADLRITIIDIDGGANAATHNLKSERAQLSALDFTTHESIACPRVSRMMRAAEEIDRPNQIVHRDGPDG
jgi:chromosome segregation ATPase